jgi:hypothetical protein
MEIDMMDIEFHPMANVFPMMSEDELEELAFDIQQHGLRESVVLYKDKILDGRNRYKACLMVNVDCNFVLYSGGDPLAFVVSCNLRRRHLSESQRGTVAANIANLERGGVGGSKIKSDRPIGLSLSDGTEIEAEKQPLVSQSQAAEMLNVSPRTLRRATHVRDHGIPELYQAVEQGEVPVGAASEIAKLPEDEQKQVVSEGKQAIRAKVKEIREQKKPKTQEIKITSVPTEDALSIVGGSPDVDDDDAEEWESWCPYCGQIVPDDYETQDVPFDEDLVKSRAIGTLKRAVVAWPKDRNMEGFVNYILSYGTFLKQRLEEKDNK